MTHKEIIREIKSLAELYVLHEGSAETALRAIYNLIIKEEAKQAAQDAEYEALFQARQARIAAAKQPIQHPIADHLDAEEYRSGSITKFGVEDF